MTGVPMRRTLSRNLIVNVVGMTLPIVTSFVTVPLYIHAIGAARYGVVTLTWILLGYLGVLDFGLSRAAANALGKLGHASALERSPVLVTTLYLNLMFGLTASAVLYCSGGALLWFWFPMSGELAQKLWRHSRGWCRCCRSACLRASPSGRWNCASGSCCRRC